MHTSRSKSHQALALLALSHGYRGIRDLAATAQVSPRAVYYLLARPSRRRRTIGKLAVTLGIAEPALAIALGVERG